MLETVSATRPWYAPRQADDEQDFAEGRPKLRFPVPLHSQHVDQKVQDQDDGNYASCRDNIAPEMDDHVACCDFKRDQCRLEDEEVVSSRESKCIIDPSSCETDER